VAGVALVSVVAKLYAVPSAPPVIDAARVVWVADNRVIEYVKT